jgi:glycosyltransferase involved in cell wall biosynthesis
MITYAIIPALNEHQTLQKVVDSCSHYVDQILVVDDGSKEPLADFLQDSQQLTVLRHKINLGKGAAMTTGVQYAQRHGAETAVFIDADGQHDPAEIPRLLEPLRSDQAEVVFGVRTFQKNMPLVARLGNTFLTEVLKLFFNINISDTQSGFRALKISAYPKIAWMSPRYAVETEMIVNAGKNKITYAQVPIATIYLDKYKGTTVIDGVRILLNIFKWRIL